MNKSRKHTAEFQAEVRQLLDLVVHSLYSKQEIFLRELISNASDAIDRAQFESLTDPSLVEDAPQWSIRLRLDEKAGTLSVEDNGIGMTAEEAETNLGTIARSGTRAFIETLKEQKNRNGENPDLIGQFGVGFYAAFMVASEVTVDSLRRGKNQEAIRWRSSGDGVYTVEPGDRDTPGTTVALKLRENATEYTTDWRIREIVRQYSDYISYPIFLTEHKDGKQESDDKPLNQTKAIWKRPKSEITKDEYKAFYQHISHQPDEPRRTIHVHAEGALEFQALLFIPGRPPMDLFMPGRRHGLHLYVRNVFIGDQFDSLIPEYLRFVAGVVDSSDLPLNISREMLQDDAIIRRIRSNLVGRVLGCLDEMKKDSPDDFQSFFRSYGQVLKEGLHGDHANRDKLKELLLFNSLQSDGKNMISLRDYRDAMPSSQTVIYVLRGESLDAARQSPHLEWCRDHKYDVLLLTDPVDSWILPMLDSYDGMPIRPVDSGEFQPGEKEEKNKEEQEEKPKTGIETLLSRLRESLKDQVQDVRASERLSQSACCLVSGPGAMPPAMERMMRAMGQETPEAKRILEINPGHPLIVRLRDQVEAGADAGSLREEAETLVAISLLAEGSPVPEPGKLAQRMASLMAGAATGEPGGTADQSRD